MQSQCFVELSTFNDLARFVCAFREYPLRVYSHEFNVTRIFSSSLTLANTLLLFYTPMTKFGRYISYNATGGKEYCDVVDSTKDISTYAPIIHLASDISSLPIETEKISDKFHPIKVKDLGSLARLTYDPEFPEETNLALYAIPHNHSWILGYLTSLAMDDVFYQFNYVELNSEPKKSFLKYQGREGQEPEFSDTFEHGFSYLSVIKIKEEHPIFGFK
ncbi:MAG: hypothetical protein ACE5DL_00035 [Nitrosopumilaceae archaeon]